MVLVKDRNKLLKYLSNLNIEAKIHYPKPLHLQKASIKYGYKKNDFPIAEYQAKHLITLPIHQFISKKQIYYMFKCIKKFYQ